MTWTKDAAELARAAGQVGAYRQQATHDTRETTAKARQGLLARFEREVDPDGTLLPHERARRAEAARKAYYRALAEKSVRARWAKQHAAQAAAACCPACGGTGKRKPQAA